jgi:CRISPR-associated protein Cas1
MLLSTKTDVLIDSTIDHIKMHAGFLRLFSEKDSILGDIPVYQINSILILGSKLNIPAGLIKLCSKEQIPIHILTDLHKHYGSLNFTIDKGILNRQSQYRACLDDTWRLYLAKQILHQKISIQLKLVQLWEGSDYIKSNYYHLLNRSLKKINDKSKLQALMGTEGQAASIYWQVFGRQVSNLNEIDSNMSLPPIDIINASDLDWEKLVESTAFDWGKLSQNQSFIWVGRRKNPCKDPINSMLSLAYGLLATQCQTSLTLHGFDPYLGILHQTNPNRPALTYDLMEVYRSLVVDLWVLGLVQQSVFSPEDFLFTTEGVCTLSPHKKNEFFKLWFKRLKYYKFTTNHGVITIKDFLEINTELLSSWFDKINMHKERDTGRFDRLSDRLIVFQNIDEFSVINKII